MMREKGFGGDEKDTRKRKRSILWILMGPRGIKKLELPHRNSARTDKDNDSQ
jgi:hypothetical protein